MVKNKLIQVRLNDSQFKLITEKAESKNQSTSEYTREILLQPDIFEAEQEIVKEQKIKISVLQRPEFLKTVVWIYSKQNVTRYENDLEDAKLYVSLIDSFIMELDPKYLEFFFNVKRDLHRAIKSFNSLFGLEYKFSRSFENVFFNYKEFEKMLLDDLM